MSKLALYQKYRSSTFEEMVGQEYIVRSIRNAVHENKVGHAYLFCGPRGTGKTSMARLLAKAVNCENPDQAPCGECDNCIAALNGTHPDIVEINAANETHVEDIRDLIDRSRLAPMQGKHKVYIIDEVHQLSSAASSALLKTLEEPPENVIFILATTDPQKLLPTIISRCQRYDFTKVRTDQIRDHLLDIAAKENIKMEANAAMMIAELSDGGMRDALSIMDQCASYTSDDITVDAIDRIYGLATTDEKVNLIKDILDCNLAGMLDRIQSYESKGIDLQRFTDGMIDILKDAVIWSNTKKEELLKVLHKDAAEEITQKADSAVCMHMCEKLLDAKGRFKVSQNAAMVFEVTCMSLATEPAAPAVQTATPVRTAPKPAFTAAPSLKPVSASATTEKPAFKPVMSVPDPDKVARKGLEEPPVIENDYPAMDEVVPMIMEEEKVDELTQTDLLSILVQCNKGAKVADENTFAMLKMYADLNSRKYVSLLEETKVGASGENCILLVAAAKAVANRINALPMNKELYFFLKDTMHTDKIVYAVTADEFKAATASFVSSMKEGTLPEPKVITKYTKETKKEKTIADRALEIFGDDLEIH